MIDDELFIRLRYKKDLDRIEAVKNAEMSATDREGNSLLHEAAIINDSRLAEFLLANGINHLNKNLHGSSPLHSAISNLNLLVAKLLLEAGANTNEFDGKGMSPLLLAIVAGDRGELIRLLIRFGADASLVGSHGYSPILLATKRNDNEILELLMGE